MPLGGPRIIGGVTGGISQGAGSSAAPAFTRQTLTAHCLLAPAYAMPSALTVVAFHEPVAIDSTVGTVAACIDTSSMIGWLLRWTSANTIQFAAYEATTPSFVSATFTETGAVGGGTRLFAWGRISGTELRVAVGRPSDVTESTATLVGGLNGGTPSQSAAVFCRPELATHDLRASNTQVAVWDSALSLSELDDIGAVGDIRSAATAPDRLWPVPTVGVGIPITTTAHVRDAAIPGTVWTPTGSGTDLVGATLT